jgi:hypothetical protein
LAPEPTTAWFLQRSAWPWTTPSPGFSGSQRSRGLFAAAHKIICFTENVFFYYYEEQGLPDVFFSYQISQFGKNFGVP